MLVILGYIVVGILGEQHPQTVQAFEWAPREDPYSNTESHYQDYEYKHDTRVMSFLVVNPQTAALLMAHCSSHSNAVGRPSYLVSTLQ